MRLLAAKPISSLFFVVLDFRQIFNLEMFYINSCYFNLSILVFKKIFFTKLICKYDRILRLLFREYLLIKSFIILCGINVHKYIILTNIFFYFANTSDVLGFGRKSVFKEKKKERQNVLFINTTKTTSE